MKRSINITVIALLLVGVAGIYLITLFAPRIYAASVPSQQINNQLSTAPASPTNPCDDTTSNGSPDNTKVQNCVGSTPIWNDIQTIVNFLSAAVGIIVTGVILVGGIQYILAGGNPSALTAARQRITNGLIALFIFLFIFAFLQWLIPGGIFK